MSEMEVDYPNKSSIRITMPLGVARSVELLRDLSYFDVIDEIVASPDDPQSIEIKLRYPSSVTQKTIVHYIKTWLSQETRPTSQQLVSDISDLVNSLGYDQLVELHEQLREWEKRQNPTR